MNNSPMHTYQLHAPTEGRQSREIVIVFPDRIISVATIEENSTKMKLGNITASSIKVRPRQNSVSFLLDVFEQIPHEKALEMYKSIRTWEAMQTHGLIEASPLSQDEIECWRKAWRSNRPKKLKA